MGEQPLHVACLGRPLELGILYDFRNDNFNSDQTLWSNGNIKQNTKLENCESHKFEVRVGDSFNKKAVAFNMEPSIKLSFLSNLIPVKGSAKYLENVKPSHRQARVILWCHCDTFIEKLQMDQLSIVDIQYKDVINATHVVMAVQYGFDAFFVFDRTLTPNEDCDIIEDFLRDALHQIIKNHDEGFSSVLINEDDQKEMNKFHCTFHADLPLINPPTTFDGAVKVYRQLPSLLRNAVSIGHDVCGVPKVVHLCSLKEFVHHSPEYVPLSVKTTEEIFALLEDLTPLKASARDLIGGSISSCFPGIQQQLRKFQNLVSNYVTQVQQKLGTILPQVRGVAVEECILDEYIKNLEISPFESTKLITWLEAKKQEAFTLNQYLPSLKDYEFVCQEKHLEEVLKSQNTKYVLALSFGTIAAVSHSYLDEMKQYLHDPQNVNEWDDSFKEHWFYSDSIVNGFSMHVEHFIEFATINKDNMELKCIVVSSPNKKMSLCIPGEAFLYTDGSRKPFQPPSPPGSPKMVENDEYEMVIQWEGPQNGSKCTKGYFIAYYRTEDLDKCWCLVNVKSTVTQCRITQLEPNTAYVFKVAAVCEAGKSEYSSPSSPFTTKMLPSLASGVLETSRLISPASQCNPAWYQMPLKETYCNKKMRLRKYEVGEYRPEVQKTKVILIVGATGSGKTTLINGMINYLFGTRMVDKFRLKLIVEELQQSQAHSQTQHITAYTINWQPGSKIHYNLTIVDTPGYGDTRGISQDDRVTKQIREFFEMKHAAAIDHIDAVGFVTQSSAVRLTDTQKYVFDAILSIFGRNVASNIFMMLTFADGRSPPALDAIKEHQMPFKQFFKFNNSVFTQVSDAIELTSPDALSPNVISNDTFDALFWQLAEESFSNFFEQFSCVDAQSLKLTKEVLAEREHLEVTIENFHQRIDTGVNHLNRIREELLLIEQFEAEMTANKHFTRTVDVPKTRRVKFQKPGRAVTNCLVCSVTCHKFCMILDDAEKFRCSAMEEPGDPDTTCRFCVKHCSWEKHVNRDYYFEEYMEKETITIEELKKKYDYADQTLSEKDNLLAGVFKMYSEVQILVIEDVETVRKSLQRLDEIAMKRHPMTTVEYIDILIRSTRKEQKRGWLKRLDQLEKARERAVMIRKMEKEGREYDPFQEITEEIKQAASITLDGKPGMIQKIRSFFGF